mmetsp:Transcript_21061/g.69642  ORF Transcript_21061/g.69642 Transcript_21061/m.69642 type:complete len:380 (+) Transcript_21061:28-1167(+)
MSKIDSIYSALFDDEVFVMYGLESVEYEINQLQDAPDAYSLQLQLRRVLRALERCDRAALAAARPALDAVAPDATAPTLRPASVTWTRENRALLVSLVLHFYEADRLSALPRDLLSGAILAYVDAPALASLCAVSREAQSAAECDAAWHEPYERQFGAGGPLRFDFGASLKERYRQRLRDPSAGDRVEVAWQGRFRLEGLEVLRRVEFEQIAFSFTLAATLSRSAFARKLCAHRVFKRAGNTTHRTHLRAQVRPKIECLHRSTGASRGGRPRSPRRQAPAAVPQQGSRQLVAPRRHAPHKPEVGGAGQATMWPQAATTRSFAATKCIISIGTRVGMSGSRASNFAGPCTRARPAPSRPATMSKSGAAATRSPARGSGLS